MYIYELCSKVFYQAMIKICLPGCLPVTPGLASGYLPGCGPFLIMRNIGGVNGGVNGRISETYLEKLFDSLLGLGPSSDQGKYTT